MKKLFSLIILAALLLPFSTFAQEETDSTGYAGDHFSLEGALELFKQSPTLEAFEQKLNKEDSYVNNLDLNEDGEIDYVKVMDNMEGEVHAIALQVDISKEETQDVAVILIEKTGAENAILQIVGDEDVYGEENIVEPFAASMDTGGKGMTLETYGAARIVVNVWAWPSVRFIYGPTYTVYRSPWYWSHYPRWWKPWRPHPWRWHYSHTVVYRSHFKPYHTHRVVKAHTFYKPKRRSSVTVRTKTVHTRTVVKKGKNGPVVKKNKTQRTSVTTKSRNGKMQSKKTTTKSKSTVTNKKGTKVKKTKTTKKSKRKKR